MIYMTNTPHTTNTGEELTVEVIANFKSLGIVAPGTYEVKVAQAYWTKTRKGDDMLKIRMEVIGGAFDGETIWDQATDAPQAWKFFFPKLAAFGITEGEYHLATAKQVAATVANSHVKIETDIRHWNNRVFTDIKGYTS